MSYSTEVAIANEKLDNILADHNKFTKLKKDPTEALKRKLNKYIEVANVVNEPHKLKKVTGYCCPGYIYGNPKIHKSIKDPPLDQ